MALAVKKRTAELSLQLLNRARERRLRNVTLLGGAREVQLLGDREKIPDLMHFHSAALFNTACVSDWSVSAPASSIRSAPSCWSVASPCGKACASCATSYRTFWPRLVMLCHPACCASPRTWPATGAGSMSALRAYPARSKREHGKIRAASG